MEAMDGDYDDRNPMISSLRRMLQADMIDRLVKMANGKAGFSQTVRQLAQLHVQQIDARLASMLAEAERSNLDTYSHAHLNDLKTRTSRALQAIYVVD